MGKIKTNEEIKILNEQIEESDCEYFAHKCAFTPKMLGDVFLNAGFQFVHIGEKILN